MTLQQIKYILGVAEIGSLNKASQQLYVSQPSLTAAIKDVEDEFGIQIFNRTSKGISVTNQGQEFLMYAKQVYDQYESLLFQYGENGTIKKHFGVSCQHYSFAVKAFVETVKKFNSTEYDFAIRETKTREVIEDVSNQKSQIGVLYMSDFNRQALTKILNSYDLSFTKLIDCNAYVYIWKNHPLAGNKYITFEQLKDYPNLSFEQGDNSSFYFEEEILGEKKYTQRIKTNDRATMLNLMVGLNGYTLCSGIISQELNGTDYIAVPYMDDEDHKNSKMEIGYITRNNFVLSKIALEYIEQLKGYLNA